MTISRRSLLRTGGSLVGAAALNTSIFGGAFAETPKKGGTLKVASGGSSTGDSLDPTTYAGNYPMTLGYMWGRPLFRVDGNMELVPDAAEGHDVTPDAKTWIVKIRQGLEFPNGKSFTASDAVWTINRHRQEGMASGLQSNLSQIESMEATSPTEVTFKLKAANADWLYVLTDYHLLMQPEGAPTDEGLGLGPYTIEAYEPGNRALLKRNPRYWRDDVAHYETIEFYAINDASARTSALQTGEIDLALQVPSKIARLLEMAGFSIHQRPAAAFSEIVAQVDNDPFTNKDLVLALKYGLNRQDLMDKVFFGVGDIGNDHPIPSFFRYHAADLPQTAYDPDKAKYHFDKAGISGDVPALAMAPMLFYTSGLEVAELYQQQLKAAGINLAIDRVPDNGYWANVWNQRPFFAGGWFGRPTEDQMLTSAYHSEAVYNGSHYKDPMLDQLLLDARSELDEDKRRQLYFDAQEMVNQNAGTIIPYFTALLSATSSNVAGFQISPVGDGSFVDDVYQVL